MQTAAFVLSIVAVLAAVFSAWMAQRSALAAERAAAQDPWQLTIDPKEGRWLKNTSRRTAFDVHMTNPDNNPAIRLVSVPEGETIHAGARVPLGLGVGITTIPSRVTITWRETAGGDVLEWTTGF